MTESWIRAAPNPEEPDVLSRVRLFAVLGTWMEADIVADSVRNAFAQGCERLYLVDNGSTDGTVARAVEQGAILARSFETDRYDESLRLRHMNDVVSQISSGEPDDYLWWLFLDADEFSHGPQGQTLLEYVRTLDRRFRVVGTRYFNHYPSGAPQYISGHHPLEFQPLCEELAYPMCPEGHRKHPLQRFDRSGPPMSCGRGFHLAECEATLWEPARPIFLHHFPFRQERVTRQRLSLLCGLDANGSSRALAADDATGHMLPRFRSLDAVYRQDWANVENFIPGRPLHGVELKRWDEHVEPEDRDVRAWGSLVGAWNYGAMPRFAYGDDTTYAKGMAFLDGHGTIEDWGCGFMRARDFVTRSRYIGIDGSSPYADKVADLCVYRSSVDCIFMRHVLEHNIEWRRVLAGALSSFKKRMVLIVFTPFGDRTRVLSTGMACTSVAVPDISFQMSDLTECFGDLVVTEEALATDTQYRTEHVFYIRRMTA
jgi:hypothetical protein